MKQTGEASSPDRRQRTLASVYVEAPCETAACARAQLSLRFTDEQKAELLRARRTYFVRVGPLLQERATIQSRLQARPCFTTLCIAGGYCEGPLRVRRVRGGGGQHALRCPWGAALA